VHHHAKPFIDGLHAERSAHQALPADAHELERLVANAARADEAAWSSLVTRFGPRIRAVARQHRIGDHDAEDVVQMTWLRLLTHIDAIREPAKVGAYLQTIARHESVRQWTAGGREETFSEERHEAADVELEPDAELLARERSAALHAALARLPEPRRKLMLMLVDEAAPSYAEISAALDMPIGSIGPTRVRSINQLRADPELASFAAA
jgi:RNA polymerase sigma factor (sigma-70 family)